MDLLKLLIRAIALDHYLALKLAIAGRHRLIEAKKTAQVDIAFGGNLKLLQCDALQRTECGIADDHAGVHRSEQVFLRVRISVAAAQLKRLVDVDRKTAWDIDTAHRKARRLARVNACRLARSWRRANGSYPLQHRYRPRRLTCARHRCRSR